MTAALISIDGLGGGLQAAGHLAESGGKQWLPVQSSSQA